MWRSSGAAKAGAVQAACMARPSVDTSRHTYPQNRPTETNEKAKSSLLDTSFSPPASTSP